MNELYSWIKEVESFIEQNEEINSNYYIDFVDNQQFILPVIDILKSLEKSDDAHYSACIFVLEICVSQLQSSAENGNKNSERMLNKLMFSLADAINNDTRSLAFWLPVLNAFYDANTNLSDELKDAYYVLVNRESDEQIIDEVSHLDAMRDFIADYSDLSIYDIAENFFAQSSAMPPDFFIDLILDLYSIDEGHEIALLTLLHPKFEVRELAISTFESLMSKITLSSESLSRLQMIRNLYPEIYHPQIDNWLKIQRKKGVIFNRDYDNSEIVKIQASEIDGAGSQGIFIHIRKNRKNRVCGLLLKESKGIKDAWLTPFMTLKEIKTFNQEAYDETLTLRTIDKEYLELMVNHFLAVTIENGDVPDLHFLEMQEELGLNFRPQRLDIDDIIQTLSVTISPFTKEVVESSLEGSKKWLKQKKLADSWFMESSQIDKMVNSCSNIVDGIKLCDLQQASDLVFNECIEKAREVWMFHFIWTALWAKSSQRKNENFWKDSFIIAYCIYTGRELSTIPIMQEICNKTIVNSMRTMHDRGTYLS